MIKNRKTGLFQILSIKNEQSRKTDRSKMSVSDKGIYSKHLGPYKGRGDFISEG